jgi:hypothetical protein
MWCLRARRLISAFHDRELDPETAQQVAAHVAVCSRCSRELERVKRGAEIASVYRPPDPGQPVRPMSLAALAEVPPGEPRRLFKLYFAAATAALLVAAGVLMRFPLHNVLWRSTAAPDCCTLDLGLRPDGNPLETVRARYFGRFREFPFEGEPGRGWVGFDYKFPSHIPLRMSLKSIMVFESGCCGGLGLVFAGGQRHLCLLEQPSDHPMSVAGLNMNNEQICRYAGNHGVSGGYSIHTWTADNLQYVLMSDLPHEDIEATVASLRYVR